MEINIILPKSISYGWASPKTVITSRDTIKFVFTSFNDMSNMLIWN